MQNLSATARRDKAARDKAMAMTDRRSGMKAENQRLRRAAIKAGRDVSGKDYDHKDNKFKSTNANRGNDGKGTKKEGPLKNISTTGYKRNSPDVNNPYNIIPSSNITMKGVDFKVKGIDNLGNVKTMKPGKNYKFKGNKVLEIPIK